MGASLCLTQAVRLALPEGWPAVTCNAGGPFGAALPFASPYLVVGSTVLLLLFGVQWWQERDAWAGAAWLLLLAGGLSNLAERTLVGCVTDYVALPAFAVFNIADMLLTVGAAVLLRNWWQRRHDA